MIHLHRDMDQLKRELLATGGMVEQAIRRATQALHDRRGDIADEIIAGDAEIDRREVDVEEMALKILALHQPVAVDLRFIAVVMKSNNDLERMADYAVNIAERAAFLVERPPLRLPGRLEEMAEVAMGMVRDSLDSFVNGDAAAAWRVVARDDVVDRYNVEVIDELRRTMEGDPETVERALHLFSVSRYLERIGDLATNIAEDVIYLVEGRIVRHKAELRDTGGSPI
jgi:phosphate transport system protein